MPLERPTVRLTGRLRTIAFLGSFMTAALLSGCGGGSGAVQNVPPPVTVPTLFTLPAGVVVAYSQVPTTVKIVGGLPPYQALSNNSGVLPVPLNVAGDTLVLVANPVVVGSDVPVTLTVSDQSGQVALANVTVRYAPLFESGVTVTPSSGLCGNNVCDGETASVRTVATGIGGSPLPGRQIRFDIVYGPVAILTSNPAQPTAPTLTVVTDGSGAAAIQIQATANATTQEAQIRATDVATGQQQIANFVVQRVTSTNNLSVTPSNAAITTLYNDSCSSGFRVDYFIYGGTPPYTVAPTFPNAVSLTPTVVLASGGSFRATTNGTCVDPLVFTIVDSAGKQTTASLTNRPGTLSPPSPPSAPTPATLVVTPSSVSRGPGAGSCTGQTFNFVITNGSPSYNVSVSPVPPGPYITPASGTVNNSGGSFQVSQLPDASGTWTVVVVDSGIPQQSRTATITCN
ncbi:MAG: hypothetical protein U1F51_02375 [Burkholderiales bacterium]